MKKTILLLAFLAICTISRATNNIIDLSGKWTAYVDSQQYSVNLPGTLAENGIGKTTNDSLINRLTEKLSFTGAATFEKGITIPENWEKHPLELFIERTKVSSVYIDNTLLGSQSSVSAPHKYIIKNGLSSGKHILKIVVDNTKSLLPLGKSHAYSESTQTNWNGILGKFQLRRLNTTDILNFRIDASTDGNCQLTADLFNKAKNAKTSVNIQVYNPNGSKCLDETFIFKVNEKGKSRQAFHFKINDPQLWDEYTPNLYKIIVTLKNGSTLSKKFGIRNFHAENGKLYNNERTVFLRGKHDGGVAPLTGYPSMNKKDWYEYFHIVKEYGINHVRYHSWTPPAAAFEAANEIGIFIQAELPLWGKFTPTDSILIDYMKNEGKLINEEFGNNPSFVMFSLGNELQGDTAVMESIVNYLRSIDNRHLYAMGTNNFFQNTKTYACEDFFASMRNGAAQQDHSTDLRGSYSFANANDGGIINSQKPNTIRNFDIAVENLNKPVIGHETGQYQSYPDLQEINKYTGLLLPLNFELIKQRIKKAGLLPQANEFLHASGALSALCYREEIEMALRTENFNGFQLLDLQDYPGQGTALVGILNVFMQSKGFITPKQWRQFCNDIVPLACFTKYCWNTNDTFTANIKVSHYGKSDLQNQTVTCSLIRENGEKLFEKKITTDIQQGSLSTIDSLQIPLKGMKLNNEKLSFHISLDNTEYHNSWNIWVYKNNEEIKEGEINGVIVTRDSIVFKNCLSQNKNVLYIPKSRDIWENSVGGLFITDFWNYSGFKKTALKMGKEPSPGTFGLLVNTTHPALKSFPTETHTNWQWWNIITASRPMILDSYTNCTPIVQVIDNWERNHKLGLIYEITDTNCNAIVCTSDLFAKKNDPEIKALFHSLISYLSTNRR